MIYDFYDTKYVFNDRMVSFKNMYHDLTDNMLN